MGHRVWANIHMDNLQHNIREIQKCIPSSTKIMAVVKADAYGHGYKNISYHLEQYGISNFGVATITEAISLRKNGIKGNILIFGRTPKENLNELAIYNLTQTVLSLEHAQQIDTYAKKHNSYIDIHIKLDTGMSRAGFCVREGDCELAELQTVCNLSNLRVKGIYSHFSCADELKTSSVEFTEKQIALFNHVVHTLESKGYQLGEKHLQNSAGIINYKQLEYDLVRPGIILYGYNPSSECRTKLDLKPVMELQAAVVQTKTLEKGTPISYGRTFTTDRTMQVATVSIGYGDGYLRALSGKGEVLLHNKRTPILGRVCMDQLVIDISHIDGVKPRDTVTLFGGIAENHITADEIAQLAGTINYEILCNLSKRVDRIPIV